MTSAHSLLLSYISADMVHIGGVPSAGFTRMIKSNFQARALARLIR